MLNDNNKFAKHVYQERLILLMVLFRQFSIHQNINIFII